MRSRSIVPIPEPFRALMRCCVDRLDEGEPVDGDLVQDEGQGYGGRVRGQDLFLFSYFEGDERWDVQLNESMVRQIAEGHHQTMDVDLHVVAR